MVTVYSVPGSHPSLAAMLMLERKGLDYRRIDLIPAVHKALLRPLGFDGGTVPALKFDDGSRVQGSRNVSRELDRLRPEPPLFPSDPDARRAVEEAERWGDEVLQDVPRRISWWALRRDHSSVASFLEDANLPLPAALAVPTTPPIAWLGSKLNGVTSDVVEADLRGLPGMLDRVDAWLEDGTLGGDDLNAADYQIATSVRLLLSFDDLRPHLEGRPAAALAKRVVPKAPGRFDPVLPAAWVEPLRRSREPAAA
jgi:glutathione S-transferase